MLRKMLKYDLKWMYKILLIFYFLTIFFAILTRILFVLGEKSSIIHVISLITNGITISLFFNIIINSLLRSFTRFIHSNYKDESYLTHTLPVKKETNYLSKVLMSIIVMFTSILIILISLFIMYYSKDNMQLLKGYLEGMATMYNSSVISFIFIMAVIFLEEMIFTILVGYTGIVKGYLSLNNKMLKSLIYGFLLYMLTQGLTLLLIFIAGLLNPSIMQLFTSNQAIDIGTIKNIMYLGILIYLIYNLGYYYFGLSNFKKGVNVE